MIEVIESVWTVGKQQGGNFNACDSNFIQFNATDGGAPGIEGGVEWRVAVDVGLVGVEPRLIQQTPHNGHVTHLRRGAVTAER